MSPVWLTQNSASLPLCSPSAVPLNPPVRHQGSPLSLVNVWDDAIGCLYHFNRRLPKELPLVVYQLPPEAHIGADNGASGLDPVVGLKEGHLVVLHQVGDAEGGRPAHAGSAMDQGGTVLPRHAVDLVGDAVEVEGDGSVGHVSQRHFYVFKLGPVEVGNLDGGIDDAGDSPREEQVPVGSDAAPAQVQRGGDLGNAP